MVLMDSGKYHCWREMNGPPAGIFDAQFNFRVLQCVGTITISYICCIFVHPDLDAAPLFAGMRETSIVHSIITSTDLFQLEQLVFHYRPRDIL